MGIQAQVAPETNPFAPAEAAFGSLVENLRSKQSLVLSHGELEQLILGQGFEVMRQLLQGHLDLRGLGVSSVAVRNADGASLPQVRVRRRGLESLFGRVEVERVGYSAEEEATLYPKDADLNLPGELYSHGVRRRVAEEVVRGSFDEAVEALERTSGAHVPKRQAEELAARAAVDFDAFYEQRELDAEELRDAGPILVLSVDGKGVVMRKEDLRPATRKVAEVRRHKLSKKLSSGEKRGSKRMATVATVYTVEPYMRTAKQIVAEVGRELHEVAMERPRPENKRVWASIEKSMEDVIREVFEEATRRDPRGRKEWVVLVDGSAPQLAAIERVAKQYGVEVTIIVDVMHVLSYLWKAAHALHGEGTKESEQWVSKRLRRLLQGRAGHVAAGIRRSATLRNLRDEKRAAVDNCADYILKYKDYLAYDSCLERGLPIATGVVEGACRHLINDRLDRTGARWRLRGAEAVLQLRALYASGDFSEYWLYHENCELERNHASRYTSGLPPIRPPEQANRRGLHLARAAG